LWTIVPVALSMAALGFTDDIGGGYGRRTGRARLHITPMTMIIAVWDR